MKKMCYFFRYFKSAIEKGFNVNRARFIIKVGEDAGMTHFGIPGIQ